jgi:chromosome segregation ATPase
MKNRIGMIVLVVICLGLGIALLMVKNKAADQQRADTESILDYSNRLMSTSAKWEEQKNVTAMLEKDLDGQKKAYKDLTNGYTQVTVDLSQTSSNLLTTEASLKAAREETAKRDARIAELENQNQVLDKQALDLSASITNLTMQIADTQKRLAASEGDKAFLEKELKRLMAEKAELEKQFNDLAVLRAQVAKLKEELNISRRIEWIRQGLFASTEQKGAQKLMRGFGAPQTPAKAAKPAYDLNVEVNADGTVKVIPPANAADTNTAPAK